MRIVRIYTGSDGESHFEEQDLRVEREGDRWHSVLMEATGVRFRETDGDYYCDWHNTPHRQFMIILEGELEIQVGDGSSRRFGPGDFFLAEDKTGRGHISRAVNMQRRRSVLVTLD